MPSSEWASRKMFHESEPCSEHEHAIGCRAALPGGQPQGEPGKAFQIRVMFGAAVPRPATRRARQCRAIQHPVQEAFRGSPQGELMAAPRNAA